MREAVEEVGRDRRMGLADAVVGRGQAVVLDLADADPVERAEDPLAHAPRHGAGPSVDADLVERPAEDVLRQHVGAATGRQEGALGDVARLDRDVHRAVADPDDEHPSALERSVVDVAVRVRLRAVEAAGVAGLGPARVPVVAVGDDQRVVAAALARLERDRPHPVGAALGALHPGREDDLVAEAEVVDVGVEVRGDVRVVREVRIPLRHREVAVLHPPPRGVDVQRAVGGRHPVGVAEDPVAADAVGLLEAVEGDAALVQRLRGGDPGRAGADDADRRKAGSHRGTSPSPQK